MVNVGDTIAAIATPPGVGAIGILRISGPQVERIAVALLGCLPPARHACLGSFRDAAGRVVDRGIALYFPPPASFTGEPVLELQGHGSPIVLDLLLSAVLELGARQARPGEFTERAFLNGKLDLTQAEAIADLVASATVAQARLALRTLQGAFARHIAALSEDLTQTRVLVEALLDFPDEDLDVPSFLRVREALQRLIAATDHLLLTAQQGERMREGARVVIAGVPNVGKSSLLNALSGEETAIVTPLPGTTRDPLRSEIELDGLPVRLIDTAGLRADAEPIEQEGIRRARTHIEQADLVLWLFDDVLDPSGAALAMVEMPPTVPLLLVRNKIDLTAEPPALRQRSDSYLEVALSARTGAGIDLLRAQLKTCLGASDAEEGSFSARRRHLDALRRARAALHEAARWQDATGAEEWVAEELRRAQQALGEITGAVSSDELLGRIFADFCIGK